MFVFLGGGGEGGEWARRRVRRRRARRRVAGGVCVGGQLCPRREQAIEHSNTQQRFLLARRPTTHTPKSLTSSLQHASSPAARAPRAVRPTRRAWRGRARAFRLETPPSPSRQALGQALLLQWWCHRACRLAARPLPAWLGAPNEESAFNVSSSSIGARARRASRRAGHAARAHPPKMREVPQGSR